MLFYEKIFWPTGKTLPEVLHFVLTYYNIYIIIIILYIVVNARVREIITDIEE